MKPAVDMTPESICRASAGEAESLQHLADTVQRRVYPYICRVIPDTDVSSDLTQDTLLRVLRSLGRLRNAERFWPWVYTIAANAARQHLRVVRRHREIPLSTVSPQAVETGLWRVERASTGSDAEEHVPRIMTAVAALGRRRREAFSLRVLEGLPYKQIAERLGCTTVCARGLVLRARRALIRELANDGSGVSRLWTTRYDQRRRLIS